MKRVFLTLVDLAMMTACAAPSVASLLAPSGNEAALVVARDLDAKVEILLETAAR